MGAVAGPPVNGIVHHLLSTPAAVVYLLVALLVFAEDALFVGFVLPGETAAILAGVDASRHHVSLPVVLVIVVAAAILGDSVGYEVGRRFGEPLLRLGPLRKHEQRLNDARALVARRGGVAVFVGRSVAFLRAVTPALAGIARMPYRRFLAYNAAGGLLWGVGAVMIGFVAGDSYKRVASAAGRVTAIVVATLAVAAVVAWRLRRSKNESRVVSALTADDAAPPEPSSTSPSHPSPAAPAGPPSTDAAEAPYR